MLFSSPLVRLPFFAGAIATASMCGSAIARPATPTPQESAPATREASPFFGKWELDLSRMPSNYGPPPKRVTFTFEDAGSGNWLTSVEITAQDDSVRHAAARYRRDGQVVKTEGDDIDGDRAAVESPAPNVLVMNLGNGKGLASVRVYAISADGQEMTESAAGASGDGTPFVRNFHFRRIR